MFLKPLIVAFGNDQEFWDNTLERRWARASFCLGSLADHISFKNELWERVSSVNVTEKRNIFKIKLVACFVVSFLNGRRTPISGSHTTSSAKR